MQVRLITWQPGWGPDLSFETHSTAPMEQNKRPVEPSRVVSPPAPEHEMSFALGDLLCIMQCYCIVLCPRTEYNQTQLLARSGIVLVWAPSELKKLLWDRNSSLNAASTQLRIREGRLFRSSACWTVHIVCLAKKRDYTLVSL